MVKVVAEKSIGTRNVFFDNRHNSLLQLEYRRIKMV